jgi:hypothetical protein
MDEETNVTEEQSKLQATTKSELDKYLNSEPQKSVGGLSPNPLAHKTSNQIPTRPETRIGSGLNQTPQNPQDETPQVKSIIRTYKSDMEETIRSQHISSLNIAVAENNKMIRKMTDEVAQEEVKAEKNYKIFIIIIILVVAGILTFAIPYFLVKNQTTIPTEDPTLVSSLIVSDTTEKINIDELNKDRIAKTLGERVGQISIVLGSIRQFYMTEGSGVQTSEAPAKVITAKRFLELIKARAPEGMLRTLKDPFMFGMHSFNGNQKFLILKVGSYETTFAGMLAWENALWYDFSELFGLKTANEVDSAGRPILGEEVKRFQDVVIKNKDTRVIKDKDGEIIFLYSVVDKSTVVLTTSPDTFKEIMNRFDKMSVTR